MIVLFYNRKTKNRLSTAWMIIAISFVIILPFMLGIGLYYKSTLLFEKQSLGDLLFSKIWKPYDGKFGFMPFIMGSVWVTTIAMLISTPICFFSSLYITQYSNKFYLRVIHPAIDILAGIPSVVYGLWGVIFVVPFISNYIAPIFGIKTMGYSVLAGAIVLSVMVIPFILNILIEIFKTIPIELSEASLSLGATKWQTIKFVLVKKALPGIIAAVGFGLARAFGETMAVLMVVGNVIKIPHSAFDPGYPLPALIANNYGEMLSIPKYDAALMFAALILFVVVMFFNALMRMLIIRYEKY
ncbi:MAG: phosphate ABC transporter permease subunit PstC [Bacteroidota bacterium]|jgi:phosphate transport system permease protein